MKYIYVIAAISRLDLFWNADAGNFDGFNRATQYNSATEYTGHPNHTNPLVDDLTKATEIAPCTVITVYSKNV